VVQGDEVWGNGARQGPGRAAGAGRLHRCYLLPRSRRRRETGEGGTHLRREGHATGGERPVVVDAGGESRVRPTEPEWRTADPR
jgi:hypothetical protein